MFTAGMLGTVQDVLVTGITVIDEAVDLLLLLIIE